MDVARIDLTSTRFVASLETVKPDLGQPRKTVKEDKLTQLSKSMASHGQISYPLAEWVKGRVYREYILGRHDVKEEDKNTVLKGVSDDDDILFLIYGHRRLLAAKEAGFADIEIDVRNSKIPLPILERRIIQIQEDSQVAPPPFRRAEEIVRLMNDENKAREYQSKPPFTVKEFSKYASVPERAIRDAYRYVYNCAYRVKKIVAEEGLSYERAVLLSWIPGKTEQHELALKYANTPFEKFKEIIYRDILKASRQASVPKELSAMAKRIIAQQKRRRDLENIPEVEDETDLAQINRQSQAERRAACRKQNILEVRESLGMARDYISRTWKLSRIDDDYKANVQGSLEEKVDSCLKSLSMLETAVAKHTEYLDALTNGTAANGGSICHVTIAKKLREIESRDRPTVQRKATRKIKVVKLEYITPDPENPRGPVADNEVESLGESIKMAGLFNALLVEKIGRKEYKLICGHRRYEACKHAGVDTVRVIEIQNLSRELRSWLQNDENTQEPFTAEERGNALIEVYELAGAEGLNDVVKMLKISRRTGLDVLSFAKLVAPEVKTLVGEGLLSYSAAMLFANENLTVPVEGRGGVERRKLTFDEQLEIAYDAVIRGKTTQSEIRQDISAFIDRLGANTSQPGLFADEPESEDVSFRRRKIYATQAEQFKYFLVSLKQTLERYAKNEATLKDIVSTDLHSLSHIAAIKKMLKDAKRDVKLSKSSRKK